MKNILLALLTIIAISCSSKPDIKELPKSANAKEEITKLQAAIDNSRSQELDLLAPESFEEARNSLSEARELQKDDKKKEKVLKQVAYGQAYLDRAQERSDKNRDKLQDVLAARSTAIDARANVLLPSQFSKMDDKVKEETAKLEKEKDSDLKEKRAEFITGYYDLELAAIKQDNIGEARTLINDARKNGAADLTPKSLNNANKKLTEADQYITQNRHDTAGIAAVSAVALASAQELDSTLTTARGLAAETPEETARRMQSEESRLNKTSDQLAEERGANAALVATNAELAQDQKTNQIYEDARKKFNSEEADVYKQGKNLVIRLKAMHFPTGQAVLKGEDFALLKKVDEVIDSFDKTTVKVEGHTDSTGSRATNQRLSNERANAVRSYLEANTDANSVSKIEAVGYGFEKPLASNKTKEGRAENRRVDIIIEPTTL